MNNETLINSASLICSRCGAPNMPNTKFCIRCGNPLQTVSTNTNLNSSNADSLISAEPIYSRTGLQGSKTQFEQVNENINEQAINNQIYTQTTNNSMYNQTTNNSMYNQNTNDSVYTQSTNRPMYSQPMNTSVGSTSMNYFKYILNAIVKPFDGFKKDEQNLGSFKNAGILSLIVVCFMTIIGLITTMINTVRVTSFWTDEVKWVWENLEKIAYFKVIGQSLLIYGGVLLATSGVYFLASLVIKKEAKFPKLLGATVTAFIPFAIATSILSPLLSLIYSPLGIGITIVGFIYTVLILLELINETIKIENKNTRIYFHLICLSVLIIGGGFIAYKLILGSISSGLGGLLGLFG